MNVESLSIIFLQLRLLLDQWTLWHHRSEFDVQRNLLEQSENHVKEQVWSRWLIDWSIEQIGRPEDRPRSLVRSFGALRYNHRQKFMIWSDEVHENLICIMSLLQVLLICNFCSKPVTSTPTTNPKNARSGGGGGGGQSATAVSPANSNAPKPCITSCSNCRKPLPRCALCQVINVSSYVVIQLVMHTRLLLTVNAVLLSS